MKTLGQIVTQFCSAKNLGYKIAIFIAILTAISVSSQQKYSFDVRVSGKGQPIILIPGYSSSGEVWNETVNQLKNNYELHVLTLPGFAGTKPIKDPVLETVKNEIIAYTKDKKLNKPVLIGHSLGAFMSLWVASSAPELYSKIIAVDGVPFYSALQNPNITAEQAKSFANKDAMVKQFAEMTDENLAKMAEGVATQMVTDRDKAKTVASWQIKSDRKTLGTTYYEMITTDLRPETAKINIPVLVLGSNYGTLEQSEKMLKEQYKNVKDLTLHIADSKHFIMYDKPE